MKNSKFIHAWSIIAFIIFYSCGGSSGGGGDETVVAPTPPQSEEGNDSGSPPTSGTTKFDVVLDSELTSLEEANVRNSIAKIESMDIDGKQIPGFIRVFKGSNSAAVVRYLEQRINYILSENTPSFLRIVRDDQESSRLSFDSYAFNLSSSLWYDKLIAQREGSNARLKINNRLRSINSSRVGAINLGNLFNSSDVATQAITLIHEARHSDCPGGAWASDLERIKNSIPTQNVQCGQLHTDGIDTFPWGPYTIDYIYSLTISRTCSNCSESERQMAQGNANAVALRAGPDVLGTMDGIYGPPNMGNSSRVREDL